jgi:hypothetical protein
MTSWMQRAKTCFSQTGQVGTDKTDETTLLSVLAVPPGAVYHLPDRLSSVSSVGVWAVFENTQLANDLIEAAMKVCDQHGDGEAARAEMRQQCLELSPRLQTDLLHHFNGIEPTFESEEEL